MRIVDNIASIHRADRQLYLLKFVQVVHEIDTAFLHLHVSIISISRAAQLELRLADCVHQRCCAAETRTVRNFFPLKLWCVLSFNFKFNTWTKQKMWSQNNQEKSPYMQIFMS